MSVLRILNVLFVGFITLFLVRQVLRLFRGGSTMDDLTALKAAGAKIVDVRTALEFADGHAAGSVNIPLDQFQGRMSEIEPGQAVIVCCAAGGRAEMAKQMLEKAGYGNVHNAGPWTRVK